MPKGRRDTWNDIRLPNAGSKLATPASLKIDLHYAHQQIWERWTWERFVRLAKFLNVTIGELASIACMPHRALEAFERRNRIYAGVSPDRATALVLTLLEAHLASEFTLDVVTNPFPNLQTMAPGTPSSPPPDAPP